MKLLQKQRWASGGRLSGVVLLLALAGISAVLAFPEMRWILRTPAATAVLWVLLAASAALTVRALIFRRWLSALFHAGMAALIVGGGITADHARQWDVTLSDFPGLETAASVRMIEGEPMTLKSFRIERYPMGMPKQYYSEVSFPEGTYEISVNHPLRRRGLTYYQHSWDKTTDSSGNPILWTVLRIRRDPGYPVVCAGYGLILLAALLRAVREERK